MSAHLSVARSALKLGFFVSSLTVASLGARLATANVSPGGDDRAFGVSAARASGGDLSDRSLRQTFDAEGSDLFARHDPGLKQPIAFDILKGYEQGAPLARWDLPPQSAQTANQAVPVSVEPILPAKPFVFHGDAADRQAALTCLTQAVYYEAGFEPIEGAQAVAQVVLNRVRHPIFPKSVCGVVYQGASLKTGCQFSFACDGSLNKTPAAGAWARAKAVAERALGGYVAKDVGEATHYHTNYVLPWWAPTVTKIAEVGTQIFYRWPGALGMPAAFNGRYAGGEHVGAVAGAPTAPDAPPMASITRNGRVHVILAANTVAAPVPVVAAAPSPANAPTEAPSEGKATPEASAASAPGAPPGVD
jgi:spore germination cell wall hydrolase CwlJ-like protein